MKKHSFRWRISLLFLSVFFFDVAFGADKPGEARPAIPLGLDEKSFYVPEDNPMTPE